MNASELLSSVRLLPVVVIHDISAATALAHTLLESGVRAVEVTLRTEGALKAIEHIASEVPDILLGAGSVIAPHQFEEVRSAGAQFVVSPGSTSQLLKAANLPFVPGASTPSECMSLLHAGYELIKFFPAESSGGAAALKSWRGPLSNARFCPTGGINEQNVADYLALDCVSTIGGSWFVPPDRITAGDMQTIRALTKQAVQLCEQ